MTRPSAGPRGSADQGRGARDDRTRAIRTLRALRVRLPVALAFLAPVAVALVALAARAPAAGAAPASAPAAPHWSIGSFSAPTRFTPGASADYYTLIVRDNGAAPTDGSAIAVSETLPAGVTATLAQAKAEGLENSPLGTLQCPEEPAQLEKLRTITCTYEHSERGAPVIEPDQTIWMRVAVSVAPGSEATATATVSGGGAPQASVSEPTAISSQPAPFGFSGFGVEAVNPSGEVDTQAGSHPYEMTTSFALNISALDTEPIAFPEGLYHDSPIIAAAAKDLDVELPPGLIGDPNAVPRCSQSVFQSDSGVKCPADTQVGIVTFDTAGQSVEGSPNEDAGTSAVYNVAPPEGQPAELGFQINTVRVRVLFHVRSESDYGITAQTPEITQLKPLMVAKLTIWGTPAEASHDNERSGALQAGGGDECTHPIEVKAFEEEEKARKAEIEAKEAEVAAKGEEIEKAEEKKEAKRVKTLEGEKTELEKEESEDRLALAELEHAGPHTLEGCPSDVPAKPFLRLPTSCPGEDRSIGAQIDSWTQPGSFVKLEPGSGPPEPQLGAFEGCASLAFDPSLSVAPERGEPTTPSGYTVRLHVPQDEEAGALGTPDLRTSTVALPAGVVPSPSAANGLQACGKGQFGRSSSSPASCPQASQLGTVKIASPLLPSPGYIEGQLFLGEPECSPCDAAQAQAGQMIRLFLQARGFGVTVKLEGSTSLNLGDGQLTTTFPNDPQLPFEELTLTVHGGPRAPLANPSSCGAFTTTSLLEPWSAPEGASATPSGSFQISGCGAPQFTPAFAAGPVDDQAGAFSPFTLSFSRSDAEQPFQAIAVNLPPGLLGLVSRVTPCPEPQAAQGSCGPESEIGTATAASGPGPEPFYLVGRAYLTGPYHEAPFGLSIVVPVQAGPFNLGDVVVRSTIAVNPYTAAIAVASEPLPRIVDGVPTQIKAVNVDVDREGFMYNPTSCAPLKVQGTLTSEQGASAPLASGFEAANCANLPFHPTFTAQTEGKTSKTTGASLHVKITSAGLGQANIAKTTVALPQQLPSRLTTLHQACLASIFEANPAACPAGSDVGTATIHTPVFDNPLTGPAYLVSHGGAAFPDLEFVLQGEGVTIVLDGKTDIKKGITTTSFQALPDAPFTTFETTLPEGPHSALATSSPSTDLCALPKVTKTLREQVPLRSHGHVVTHDGHVVSVAETVKKLVPGALVMPTTIVGQNGAVVTQDTAIAVTGCHGVKSFKAKRKPKRR
jgi:hypothetical protein